MKMWQDFFWISDTETSGRTFRAFLERHKTERTWAKEVVSRSFFSLSSSKVRAFAFSLQSSRFDYPCLYFTSYFAGNRRVWSMASKLRISKGMVYPFIREGDVIVWLKKIRLVAKLVDIEELMSFMPLYLSRGNGASPVSGNERGNPTLCGGNKGQVKWSFCGREIHVVCPAGEN